MDHQLTLTASAEEEEETSLAEAIAIILRDKRLCDITLIGTDGLKVRTNRFILAARSPTFYRLLFVRSDPANKVLFQNFDGAVLKAVAEYIHTDTTSKIPRHWTDKKHIVEDPYHDTRKLPLLVSIAEAAFVYGLPVLRNLVMDAIRKALWKWPRLCLAFLDACEKCPNASPQECRQKALEIVRANRYGRRSSLTADHVAHLRPAFLEQLLKDRELRMTSTQKFDLIHLWAESADSQSECSNRCRVARNRLSPLISLENIELDVLSKSVLVSEKELLKATVFQGFGRFISDLTNVDFSCSKMCCFTDEVETEDEIRMTDGMHNNNDYNTAVAA